MKVFREIAELRHIAKPVHLAIGVFDGVHLGHQAVIGSAMESAAREGAGIVVVTFDPHPARVLAKDRGPRMLTSARHQQVLLERLGVESLLVVPFDGSFASLSGEAFVRALRGALEHLAGIHVGASWRFGRDRKGDVALLRALGKTWGFRVFAVHERERDGHTVSSTAIRRYVEKGELTLAAAMLGRPYSVLGTVVRGRRLGLQLGFPTANVDVGNEQLPPLGVYAVKTAGRLGNHVGVANLGIRPTVERAPVAKPSLEVHLFDFSGDLYDEELEVTFVAFLRAERRFPALKDLQEQIQKDIEAARERMV